MVCVLQGKGLLRTGTLPRIEFVTLHEADRATQAAAQTSHIIVRIWVLCTLCVWRVCHVYCGYCVYCVYCVRVVCACVLFVVCALHVWVLCVRRVWVC